MKSFERNRRILFRKTIIFNCTFDRRDLQNNKLKSSFDSGVFWKNCRFERIFKQTLNSFLSNQFSTYPHWFHPHDGFDDHPHAGEPHWFQPFWMEKTSSFEKNYNANSCEFLFKNLSTILIDHLIWDSKFTKIQYFFDSLKILNHDLEYIVSVILKIIAQNFVFPKLIQ